MFALGLGLSLSFFAWAGLTANAVAPSSAAAPTATTRLMRCVM